MTNKPVRRCVKLMKRLQKCPNEPPVVDEEKEEVTTWDAEAIESPCVEQDPLGLGGHQGIRREREREQRSMGMGGSIGPYPSEVGEALDQILSLAEHLQEDIGAYVGRYRDEIDVDSSDGLGASSNGCAARDEGHVDRITSSPTRETLFDWLFPYGRKREKPMTMREEGKQKREREANVRKPAWSLFAREFQDV